MSATVSTIRGSHPETVHQTIRLLGVDDDDPTKEVGAGVTVTRTGEGVYRITWANNPGVFLGIVGYCFGAATMSDVKGYTLTRDTYPTDGTYLLDVSVWDSTFAAADIIADQYVDITVAFSNSSVS